ncbi:cell division protein SepF [Staphylococcus sp. EG-SA-6]|uniref:Cell division protein SepF n=3 Tax=Bacillales TaxID=1385 RepID=SEPF_STAHJ|nr:MULTISPECIES: cell division protein SepF [Staphylococcus]Q4L5P0.1 RecName: Full=Cell division protein SepF [Staphylococcus haemolyticus JCSC1435]KDP49544.1 PF04472 family protein [Staphylococcus aureus subsp. aureus CO-98]MBN4934927.1 cell division protein SepF [Staphylococcus sp. EG-SA-6]GEU17357.1 cell division protein SepF [Bacillus anthracis]AKC76517.1 cell division-like FtsZ-interacting protein [Staphylococcus haemolyticus]AMW23149.1 cell division protein SepF [Staphylococcus haemolyt
MAIKDLFNNFFLMDDEEEVESPEERQRRVVQNEENETNNVQQNQPQQSERSYSNQSKLKTVPQKKTTRNYNSEERNVRMNQPPSKSNGKNVVTMNQTSQSYSGYESSKMCLFEPRVFSDTQDIADELKNRRATLVNLQRIDKISAKRIIDFLSGTVYAIGGDIQRVGTDIFLCTPDNVEVAGSITDHIEQMESQHYE